MDKENRPFPVDVLPSEINVIGANDRRSTGNAARQIQVPLGIIFPREDPEKVVPILPVLMNPAFPQGQYAKDQPPLFKKIRDSRKDQDIKRLYDIAEGYYDLETVTTHRKYKFFAGVNFYLNSLLAILTHKRNKEDQNTALDQLLHDTAREFDAKVRMQEIANLLSSPEGVRTFGLAELVKCSTTQPRNPTYLVMKVCFSKFLVKEITARDPKIILCFGSLVHDFLGNYPEYQNRLVRVYHPAFFERMGNANKEKIRSKIENELECLSSKIRASRLPSHVISDAFAFSAPSSKHSSLNLLCCGCRSLTLWTYGSTVPTA